MDTRAQTKFDVIISIDMETDLGSFTSNYDGVKYGTGELLSIMDKYNIKATYFWTAHAVENNIKILKQVRKAGHEIGCHGLIHETLGDPLYPLPNTWSTLSSEVEGRIQKATRIIKNISGVLPVSFRCPRLWCSTKVINVLEKLGYVADASLPLYYYRTQFVPYHPSVKDWTKKGRMKIVEIPNFCDLTMKSKDPLYNRDRDQWSIFRVKSASFLLKKVDGFIKYVELRQHRAVVCFYFHPWEFYEMPRSINCIEATVRPALISVKNCGKKGVKEFDKLCVGLSMRGARFVTTKEIANEY